MPAIKRLEASCILLNGEVIDKIIQDEMGGACSTYWGRKEPPTRGDLKEWKSGRNPS
jgi:hypothetical protein